MKGENQTYTLNPASVVLTDPVLCHSPPHLFNSNPTPFFLPCTHTKILPDFESLHWLFPGMRFLFLQKFYLCYVCLSSIVTSWGWGFPNTKWKIKPLPGTLNCSLNATHDCYIFFNYLSIFPYYLLSIFHSIEFIGFNSIRAGNLPIFFSLP